jgi:hypothetical protein
MDIFACEKQKTHLMYILCNKVFQMWKKYLVSKVVKEKGFKISTKKAVREIPGQFWNTL